MSTPTEPNTWPLWGRALFWLGFASVLVVAAIAAFHGQHRGAAVRVALIVVLVPAVVSLIGTLVTRRSR